MLSEDFYWLKRIFECQLNDKDTHDIYLNYKEAISVVRTMHDIEERIIEMENIVIPQNQKMAEIKEDNKIVRLDQYKLRKQIFS